MISYDFPSTVSSNPSTVNVTPEGEYSLEYFFDVVAEAMDLGSILKFFTTVPAYSFCPVTVTVAVPTLIFLTYVTVYSDEGITSPPTVTTTSGSILSPM